MDSRKRVLNVGGNSKDIPLHIRYDGWDHVLLDIDPTTGADIVCDAREMSSLPAKSFDSVYCSQNLEHYHRHDVVKVLDGFRHVLKDDGFAFVIVPDLQSLMRIAVERNLDVDDVLYKTGAGCPILVRDVIYGWGHKIETSGQDFYAHKTGFSLNSLTNVFKAAGFPIVFASRKGWLDVMAFAFKAPPGPSMQDFAEASLFRLQNG